MNARRFVLLWVLVTAVGFGAETAAPTSTRLAPASTSAPETRSPAATSPVVTSSDAGVDAVPVPPSGIAGSSIKPADLAVKPTTPAPLSPRMRLMRERIDVLFRHRSAPPLTGDPRLDPFRPAGAIAEAAPLPAGNGTAVPREIPTSISTDLALLQQGVATLKVSGIFEIAGRQHLVVNSRPYKEGDVIQATAQGKVIYLRVRQISRTSLTLVLNEAEMTLKF